MILSPPIPTLFPYTTLFRSSSSTSRTRIRTCRCSRRQNSRAPAHAVCSATWLRNWIGAWARFWRLCAKKSSRRTRWSSSPRSEEHTSELQSPDHLVCRLLLENDTVSTDTYTLSLHDALPIFFLYLAHTYPHVPLFASAKFKGTSARGLFGDVVEELDWSVGQILEALRKEKLAENTLVFFTKIGRAHV